MKSLERHPLQTATVVESSFSAKKHFQVLVGDWWFIDSRRLILTHWTHSTFIMFITLLKYYYIDFACIVCSMQYFCTFAVVSLRQWISFCHFVTCSMSPAHSSDYSINSLCLSRLDRVLLRVNLYLFIDLFGVGSFTLHCGYLSAFAVDESGVVLHTSRSLVISAQTYVRRDTAYKKNTLIFFKVLLNNSYP